MPESVTVSIASLPVTRWFRGFRFVRFRSDRIRIFGVALDLRVESLACLELVGAVTGGLVGGHPCRGLDRGLLRGGRGGGNDPVLRLALVVPVQVGLVLPLEPGDVGPCRIELVLRNVTAALDLALARDLPLKRGLGRRDSLLGGALARFCFVRRDVGVVLGLARQRIFVRLTGAGSLQVVDHRLPALADQFQQLGAVENLLRVRGAEVGRDRPGAVPPGCRFRRDIVEPLLGQVNLGARSAERLLGGADGGRRGQRRRERHVSTSVLLTCSRLAATSSSICASCWVAAAT